MKFWLCSIKAKVDQDELKRKAAALASAFPGSEWHPVFEGHSRHNKVIWRGTWCGWAFDLLWDDGDASWTARVLNKQWRPTWATGAIRSSQGAGYGDDEHGLKNAAARIKHLLFDIVSSDYEGMTKALNISGTTGGEDV